MSQDSNNPPSSPRRDHCLALGATLLTCLFLWLPGDSIPPLEDGLPFALPPHLDKAVHFGLFFCETLLLRRSLRWWRPLQALTRAAQLALGFALVTELSQAWIPQRSADGLDLLANGLGVLAFVFVYRLWRRPDRPTAMEQEDRR